MKLGELHYNVVFSRYLNPNDNEDAAYLVGQPPPPERLHLLRRLLRSPERKSTAEAARIAEDHRRRRHNSYDAIPSESLYALPLGGKVEAEEQVPVLDSTAQQGPIEGSLVLFLLPAEASQPAADAHIPGPEGAGKVILDL